jgi:DNA-binding transcriptional ArsR family regulator
MRRDVFQAIADPTRRAILGLIVSKPLNLNTVAENFEMSRPAISKHIKILTECGLIVIRQEGRERFCQADLMPLGEVARWMEPYKQFWTAKLDALEHFLEQEPTEPKAKKHKHKKHKKHKKHG